MPMRELIRLVEAADGFAGVPALTPEKRQRLAAAGFDTEYVLYHGSDADFDVFDLKRLKTAQHIYTTPDPDTARAYGKHVYLCLGIQDPQADLIDDWPLIGKLADTFAADHHDAVESDEELESLREQLMAEWLAAHPDSDEFDARYEVEDSDAYKAALHQTARRYVVDLIQSGELYGVSGSRQNSLMRECFGLGYRSVRFIDPSSTGQCVSVVFNHASDLVIVGKLGAGRR